MKNIKYQIDIYCNFQSDFCNYLKKSEFCSLPAGCGHNVLTVSHLHSDWNGKFYQDRMNKINHNVTFS